MPQPVRLACVRYLNTAPLIDGLESVRGLSIRPAVPAAIVGSLEIDPQDEAAADIGLASIVDAVRSQTPLALLPVGMIGCDGPTLTVRVFSAVPFDKVRTIHADTDSHTSVVLAQVVLEKLHGRVPAIVDFDARERVSIGTRPAMTLEESWPETVLLIGDKVVTDCPPDSRYPYQLDLGEAWKRMTGLPFVYAMWMCRASEAEDVRVRTAAALLDRQRRHNLTRLGHLAEQRAPLHRWPAALARRYVGELLRYTVTPEARAGLHRFLSDAAKLGLCPNKTPVWIDDWANGRNADAVVCGAEPALVVQ